MTARKSPHPQIVRDVSRDRLRAMLVEPGGERWVADSGVSLIEKRHAASFMRTYRGKVTDFSHVRDAFLEFRPDLPERLIDRSRPRLRINTYAAPDAIANMVLPEGPASIADPGPLFDAAPETMRLVLHVLGDEETAAAFCNWLAFVLQTGTKTRTGWILQGVMGGGKSLLHSHVLSPVFGPKHVPLRVCRDLEQTHNEWHATCQLLWVDDFHRSNVRKPTSFMERLGSAMTSPRAFVWSLRTVSYEVESRCNVILASVRERPMELPLDDNLWNVGEWHADAFDGPKPSLLLEESRRFAGALSFFDVDPVQARGVLQNHARRDLCRRPGEEALPDFCHRLATGDPALFGDVMALDPRLAHRYDVAAAQAVCIRYLDDDLKWGHRVVVRNPELRLLFHVLTDPDDTMSAPAFNAAMRAQGFRPRSFRYAGSTRTGHPYHCPMEAAKALLDRHDVLVRAHKTNVYGVDEVWRSRKFRRMNGRADYASRAARANIERKT